MEHRYCAECKDFWQVAADDEKNILRPPRKFPSHSLKNVPLTKLASELHVEDKENFVHDPMEHLF